jgi:hypothetical protein
MLEADLLRSFLGKPKHNVVDNDQTKYSFNCPKCKIENNNRFDNKYNLEVELNNTDKEFKFKKICHCWVCGLSGSLDKVFKRYAPVKQKSMYFKLCTNRMVTGAKKYDSDDDDIEIENKIELPNEFIPFSQMDYKNPKHLEALNYLKDERKLNINTIKFYKIGFCIEGIYKNRLIIPSYNLNGELNFFITRIYQKYSKIKEKYMNPEFDKTKVIINENNINWNETIYLVEGMFDMFALPINTIPLLGKDLKVNSELFKKILLYKPNIIICLDEDAKIKQKELCSLLRSYNLNVEVIKICKKDLAKNFELYGKDSIITLLFEPNNNHINKETIENNFLPTCSSINKKISI